ncbi:MAG: hypothetical protein HY343_00530 [Lentisphaerae bacterium]|nr:hypothetical protein [Lentisphaerota bacterium]
MWFNLAFLGLTFAILAQSGPIIGFAFAFLALLQIKISNGELRGRGIAIIGLVCSSAMIAAMAIMGGWFASGFRPT